MLSKTCRAGITIQHPNEDWKQNRSARLYIHLTSISPNGNCLKKQFVIGFACGLLLFIAISLFAAQLTSDCGLSAVFGNSFCADAISRVGWPLQY